MACITELLPAGKIFGQTGMIFLTVGTWYKGFDRLVKAVDELVGSGVISDTVIVQTGYSSYRPKHIKVIDFCSPDEFAELISKATVVVSHAGMGTIIQSLKQCKPVVVVPRRRALGEVSNDHQFSTAKHLETEGKVLVAYEIADLPAKLKQAKTFAPASEQRSEKILHAVQEFIDKTAAEKCLRQTIKSKSLTARLWPYRI